MQHYFSTLVDRFGKSWNEFWFRPSDPYTLGLIRLLTGMVALYWYLMLIPDVQNFFGPEGILPGDLVRTYRFNQGFSYFDLLQSSSEVWAGYIAGLVVLVLFTAGFYSRVASILAWVVVLSVIQRGPMLAGPIDDVLAMMMLYLWIGPSGESFSVDSFLRGRKANDLAASRADVRLSWLATISLRLIQLHLAAAYFLMAVAKMKVDTWWSGTAVWWISATNAPRLVDLTWLARNTFTTYIMNAWTHSIPLFELAFSLLVWNRLARPLMLAFAVPHWISVGIVTDQYVFAVMMMIASMAYISSPGLRHFIGNRWRAQHRTSKRPAPVSLGAN